MIHRFVCAAACILSTAASAQSSVTIYGVVDLGLSKANKGTTNAAAAQVNGNAMANGFGAPGALVQQQGVASRLGFAGREDLGGGNYARFDLQHRFTPDNGASSALFWAGKSIVALGNTRYGEILLGREYIPAFAVAVAGDPAGHSFITRLEQTYTMAGFSNGTPADGPFRHANAVLLRTANLNGFTAEVMTAAKEAGEPDYPLGVSLVYAKGPVYAGLAYEGRGSDTRMWLASASYDFGVVRPIVNFATARGGYNVAGTTATPNYRARSYAVGASAPVAGGRLYVSRGHYDPTDSGAGVAGTLTESVKYSVGYEYPLSKRTTLYGMVATADKEDTAAARFSRSTAWALGVRHTF